MKKPQTALLIFLSAGIIIQAASCAKNLKDEKQNGSNGAVTDEQNLLMKEYTTEGFIDKSTFRVVIIGTKEDCESDEKSIEKKSKNRALSSLQKYLASQEKNTDENTRAGILNMMSEYGHFYKKDPGCEKRNIYYFEIKKEGIKTQILDLGGHR